MPFAAFSNRLLSARRRWLAPTTAVLVACAGLPMVAGAYQAASERAASDRAGSDQAADMMPAKVSAALGVLRDDFSTLTQRQEAASLIASMTDEAAVRSVVQQVIAGPLTPAARTLLEAIAALPDAHPRLFPVITQRLSDATAEEAPRLLECLGAFHTRESVRLLARYLEDDAPEASVQAAMGAMAKLSARDDLPMNRKDWAGFAQEVELISDSQWRIRLIGALNARQRRLDDQRRDAMSQLVEANRKLHLATPSEQRPEFLASLLLNNLAEVRNLGFELIARELSVTGRLDGPVGDASLTLLTHDDPSVRANAAVLVRQLAPDGAETSVAAALAVETDPKAAADLLLAAARWPSSEAVPSVLKWAQAGTQATDAAFEAAWWLLRSGHLRGDAATQVLAAVRATPEADLTPAAVSLLSAIGEREDLARFVPLLNAPSGAVRQAAGEALVWHPEFGEEILTAASMDADLFEVASRAVLVNRPTAANVRRLLELPMPGPERANPAILRAANALTADELLVIARDVGEPTLRRGLLSLLLSPQRLMSEKADPEMLAAISEGVLELADLELNEEQPEAALAVLDNSPFAEPLVDAQKLGSLRCAALLGLGHVEIAQGFTAPVEAWIRGLRLAKGTEAAAKVLQEIDARFASTMSLEQKQELEVIRREIAAAGALKKSAERATPLGPG